MLILPYRLWITQYPPAIPKLYYGAISQEQRMCEIAKRIYGVEKYLEYLSSTISGLEESIRKEVEALIEEAQAEIEKTFEEIRTVLDAEIEDLRAWVEAQTFSVESWDVTRGRTDTSVEVNRRLFFDVTVFGTTVQQLAESERYQTVQQLAESGWNVRALAVIGAEVLDHVQDPTPWHADPLPGDDSFDPVRLSTARVDTDGFVIVP